ncbi:ribonuclease H-like domain-containing protein [Tanacetum coccineum]
MRRVNIFTPMESDVDRIVPKIAAGSSKRDAEEELDHQKLKILFETDIDDELWKSQKHIHDITWRLYDTCGVHNVFIKDGVNIYMLVEREYPLSRGVLTQMLVAKLLVEQNYEMSKELLRKIFMQERVKSILLLAIPDEYLLKFYNVADAKSLWAAIKASLDKAYDRFQKLISQLEVHGAPISKEDINQKFLKSLPPSWNQIALIMRNKPNIDEIDIDDLYNNLRIYEDKMKKSSSSTSISQNLAFLSSENTSSTNEVSTASGDFGIDEDDLEELDLRWQVAMLTIRGKKFIQKTGRNLDFKEKRPVSLDKSKIKCYNCHRKGHFDRECRSGRNQGRRSYGDNGRINAPTNESSSQALVAQDGLGGYD